MQQDVLLEDMVQEDMLLADMVQEDIYLGGMPPGDSAVVRYSDGSF